MSILEIELTPSIEKKLDEGAKKSGVSKAEYARAMLEKMVTEYGKGKTHDV